MWKVAHALVAIVALTVSGAACAGDWPTRPLTMIHPFAAGGPNDATRP